jgi:hypothetical protein
MASRERQSTQIYIPQDRIAQKLTIRRLESGAYGSAEGGCMMIANLIASLEVGVLL